MKISVVAQTMDEKALYDLLDEAEKENCTNFTKKCFDRLGGKATRKFIMLIILKKSKKKARQRAIFTRSCLDIVATTVLNFCVRDGNRCVHRVITTRPIFYSG